MNAMVFPQDQPGGEPGKARAGGLTIRTYTAIQLAAALVPTTGSDVVIIERAVRLADLLLAELEIDG